MKQFLLTLTDTKIKKIFLHFFIYSLIGGTFFSYIMPGYIAGDLNWLAAYITSASMVVSGIFLLVFLLIRSFVKKRNFFIKLVLVVSLIIPILLGLFSIFIRVSMLTYPKLPYVLPNLLYIYLPLVFILGSTFLWLLTPKTKLVLNFRRAIFVFTFLYIVLNIFRLNHYAYWKYSGVNMLGIIPLWGWLFLVSLLILTPFLNTRFFNDRKKVIFFILIVFYFSATLVFWKINPYTCSNNSLQTFKYVNTDRPFFLSPDYYDDKKTIIKLTRSSRYELRYILKKQGHSDLSEKLSSLKCLEKLGGSSRDLSWALKYELSPDSNFDFSFLSDLNNLKELDLANTQFSDVSILSNLDSLKEINLENTLVTDISPLANLPNLESVHREGTSISKEECKRVVPEKTKCK